MAQFVGITRIQNNALMALESNGDLYVVTSTAEGWKSHYVGNLIAGKKPEAFPKVVKGKD